MELKYQARSVYDYTIKILASELKPGDIIIRKHGARRDMVRSIVRYQGKSEIDVQFTDYYWDMFNNNRSLDVLR